MLLSGYCPSAATVEQIGLIARELKSRSYTKPGSFFWVLDPVMGDNGRIYVAEDELPVYKSLLKDADLILPNQFEAELLSDVRIHDLATMKQAITKLHSSYQVPHVLITSIRLPPTASNTPTQMDEDLSTSAKLSIIGSTCTSDMKPRLFRITVPALPVFFSGTGDMFASLMVARLRQAAQEADVLTQANWRSPDEVPGPELPLAKAAEKVLASMHTVLKDTAEHYDAAAKKLREKQEGELNEGKGQEADEEKDAQRHLTLTRAAEVRVVRNVKALVSPPVSEDFQARAVNIEADGGS
jgi:pyridoxine kinase